MKKLLAALLILVMVPVIALAEDLDPIVGGYYLYYNVDETPEEAAIFPNNSILIGIFIFQPDGTIMIASTEVNNNGDNESGYGFAGKWSKTDDQYSYSIVGIGEGNGRYKYGDLYLSIESGTVEMRLHKLMPFNPYRDYIFK